MGESSEDLQQSFFRRHWEGYKEFWAERFSFLDNYSRFIKRDKPLPLWSSVDVQEFIASDPVHGPTLQTAREAVNFGLTGSVIGAVSTAGVTWKYSRSLHGLDVDLAKLEMASIGDVANIRVLACILGCRVASLLMKYLGLLLRVPIKAKSIGQDGTCSICLKKAKLH